MIVLNPEPGKQVQGTGRLLATVISPSWTGPPVFVEQYKAGWVPKVIPRLKWGDLAGF